MSQTLETFVHKLLSGLRLIRFKQSLLNLKLYKNPLDVINLTLEECNSISQDHGQIIFNKLNEIKETEGWFVTQFKSEFHDSLINRQTAKSTRIFNSITEEIAAFVFSLKQRKLMNKFTIGLVCSSVATRYECLLEFDKVGGLSKLISKVREKYKYLVKADKLRETTGNDLNGQDDLDEENLNEDDLNGDDLNGDNLNTVNDDVSSNEEIDEDDEQLYDSVRSRRLLDESDTEMTSDYQPNEQSSDESNEENLSDISFEDFQNGIMDIPYDSYYEPVNTDRNSLLTRNSTNQASSSTRNSTHQASSSTRATCIRQSQRLRSSVPLETISTNVQQSTTGPLATISTNYTNNQIKRSTKKKCLIASLSIVFHSIQSKLII